MKNKIIIYVLAIFILAGCIAAVYAETAHVGSIDFDVPSGLSISQSSDSEVVLTGNNKEIIVTTDTIGQSAITSYMEAKGFTFTESFTGTTTVTSMTDGSESGSYRYASYGFEKGSESAEAYALNKDGVDFSVIVINHGSASAGTDSDASEIMNDIML